MFKKENGEYNLRSFGKASDAFNNCVKRKSFNIEILVLELCNGFPFHSSGWNSPIVMSPRLWLANNKRWCERSYDWPVRSIYLVSHWLPQCFHSDGRRKTSVVLLTRSSCPGHSMLGSRGENMSEVYGETKQASESFLQMSQMPQVSFLTLVS